MLRGGSTLVEEVDVKMVGDGELAGGNGTEQGGFTAAVLAEETVAATKGEFEG